MTQKNEPLITALYERLSRDDDQQGDSNSIVNQKSYLTSYVADHGFSHCQHYTDDGFSGGNFERPGWKQLIADIDAGLVGTVIAKDLSRVGRDYIQTGFYTEVYFRRKGVRFIAIGNGVDTVNPISSEFAPFMNVLNEMYLREQSKKMRTFFRQRGNSGKPTNTLCVYGYMSCSSVTNEYDGVHHDYTRKKGLMWERVFLPENAPVEWQDRAALWNAVEDAEKSKDSRLAREFVVALPRELNADQQIDLLTEYIKQQFVADGMCADVGIHDPDPPGHNPHAHILLTIRPLDEQGKWQYKTEKEYLCIRGDEERGFTAAEFLHAQDEGWDKQYPYLVSKKKVYKTTADGEAQGLKRASKHPKSTTYGRQNPITERWNSESQLILWRSAWADIVNLHLERLGSAERVDHRSHAERGLDEQPTIHEGVAGRTMEKKGVISDRCELNRQIKADNALLRELKDLVTMLTELVADAATSIADQLTKLREKLLVICYQIKVIIRSMDKRTATIQGTQPKLKRYNELTQQIKQKTRTRKALVAEQKNTSKLNLIKQHDLSRQITTLTEEIEELRSEKENLLLDLGCADDAGVEAVQSEVTAMAASLHKLDEQKERYSVELDEALQQYKQLKTQATEADSDDIQRNAITDASKRLQQTYGKRFDAQLFRESQQPTAHLLGEEERKQSLRAQLARSLIRSNERRVKNVDEIQL